MRWFSRRAGCRCRTPEATAADLRDRGGAGTCDEPDLRGADAADRHGDTDPVAVRRSGWHLSARHDHRALCGARGAGDRRLSLHASRLQRAVGARRVARGRTIARRGGEPARITVQWTPLRDSEWEAALRPRATRTVLAAVSAELPQRLADALAAAAASSPAARSRNSAAPSGCD